MATEKARPNKITDSYLEEEFKRIFERPAGGFPEGVESLEDKSNYLKAGNEMRKTQAAEKLEAQVKNIAEMHKEIERREKAPVKQQQSLAEEARKNLAKLDAQVEGLGLFNNSGKNVSVAEGQPEKGNTPTEAVAKVDDGNISKEVKAPGLFNNSNKEQTEGMKEAPTERVQQNQVGPDNRAETPGLFNNSDKEQTEGMKEASTERVQQNQIEPDKRSEVPGLSSNQNKKQPKRWEEARAERQQTFAQKREAFAERVQQNLEVLNEQKENLAQAKEDLTGMVHKKLGKLNADLKEMQPEEKDRAEAIRKQIKSIEGKAKDLNLSHNPDKTEKESQENSKEDKGLLSRVFQLVKKVFEKVVNFYNAEKKDPSIAAHGDTQKNHDNKNRGFIIVHENSKGKDNNASFVRINQDKFDLTPGEDFHHKSGSIDIHITYKNSDSEQAFLMNIKINGEEHSIQPGKSFNYQSHGSKIDVVYGHQQNRNIDRGGIGKGDARKALETSNVEAKTSKPSETLKNVKVGSLTPDKTPNIPRSSSRGIVV